MISGVVLARNEEINIVGCLQALQPHVDEILLIDMESTDRTVELATPYVQSVLRHRLVRNFDGARNIAIDKARNAWLWFVDADERIPQATGKLVCEAIRTHGSEYEAISIPFKSYCGRQWMKHCGWWPGYTGPRVLKRGHFRFADRVHGGVHLEGRELRVAPNPQLGVDHYGIRSIEHYADKVNRYSSAEAENLAQAGATWNWRAAIAEMMREIWQTYEWNPGNLDGEWGWVAAWMSGQYRWQAQSKLLDLNSSDLTGSNPTAVPADLDDVIACMEDSLAQLRKSSPTLPLGVVWKADVAGVNGYSEEARTFLHAMAYGSRPLALESPLRCHGKDAGVDRDDQALFRALRNARRPRHSLTVTHSLPGAIEPDARSSVNALRTMIETDRVPASWIPHIQKFDQVWVPSQHSADAFRRSWIAPEKIHIVPGCLDTEIFQPDGVKCSLPSQMQGKFVFLSVFDWVPRKGGELLVQNYCREFAPGEGTGLLIKLSRIHGMSLEEIRGRLDECLHAIGQSLEERPDVCLLDQETTTQEMAALYRSVDAFVLPSRGEGWGRPYMEAMACGLPTIGTDATGQIDFMTEENSLLIPAKEVDVPENAARDFPLFDGHRWCEPNCDELRRLMRQVVNDPKLRERISHKAVQDIHSRFNLDAGANGVELAIQAAEKRFTRMSAPPIQENQTRVILEGELFSGHSFSNINEQLCLALARDSSLAVSIRRLSNGLPEERPPFASNVEAYIDRELPNGPQVTIRHAYPPDWNPPEKGLWIHVQPWEYGHLPKEWIEPLRDRVDEIWVPSHYVRKVYERSGIPSEKIQVIPWGVNAKVFTPEAPPLILPTNKGFHFLYVGGTIARKGFDRVLEAYLAEFGPEEDVGLVVKDIGSKTVYRHHNYAQATIEAQSDPTKPEILYLDEPLTQGQLASLFAACDCLVAPYRGEGFGMPILEAMACGTAPIVPQGGASDDFTTPETAFTLPSEEVEVATELSLFGPLLELSVSPGDLQKLMRQVVTEYEETKRRGQAASEYVRDRFTWNNSATKMSERIALLTERASSQSPEANSSASNQQTSSLSAIVMAPEEEAAFADTLSCLRPFVEQVFCVADKPTETVLNLAQEYGCEVVSRIGEIDPQGKWFLYLESGEVLDDQELESLTEFLTGVPKEIEAIGAHVLLQDRAGKTLGRQVDLRLFRGNFLDNDNFPCTDVHGSGMDQSAKIPIAELKIIASVPWVDRDDSLPTGLLPDETWLTSWIPAAGEVFLDIGANQGLWTHALSNQYQTIHSVEPGPDALKQLKLKLPGNAYVHEFAAWDIDEQREFSCFDDSRHLSTHFQAGGVNTGPRRGSITLKCQPIDDLKIAGRVDLIKCDVEGAEIEALKGAQKLITLHHPRMLVEVHSRDNLEQVLNMILVWGYDFKVIRHPNYRPFSANWWDHCWLAAAPKNYLKASSDNNCKMTEFAS
ncbi:D-inositol-3-phosphate glycosyltransferase [Bremerella volcania]|uniref:D-inositol-3-phosphate glycosyltransferase n=2 Tax=Bremerella volcania TaxID=2527984 RepID=A0A518C3D5_9BACT|nr:D-inositol-3-phosphate glycosyltransferase [Bremerella volcania]